MSGQGGDRLDRGYRAANYVLDERPAAATRAAILAAAARQVQSGPRDAQSPRGAPRARSMLRWPMAAAAAVLLSTLAVMMAARTEREMPSFTAPADVAEPKVSTATDGPSVVASSVVQTVPAAAKADSLPAAPPVAMSAEAGKPAVERKRELAKESGVAAPAAPPIAVPPATAPSGAARSSVSPARDQASASAQVDAKAVAAAEGARAKEEVAALTAPAMPATPSMAREALRGNESMPAARAPTAKADATPPSEAEGRRNERVDSAGAALSTMRQAPAPSGALGAVVGTSRSESDARTEAELRAEDWLERIIKLRKAGRHDDADAELKRFRERYPQVQVPSEALPATGTR